jgi:hypothetical protein
LAYQSINHKEELMTTLLSVFLLACGPKNTEPEQPPAMEAPPVEAPVEEPVVEEPEPEPDIISNIDLNATFTFADGSSKKAHVVRVERNKKFNGKEEWLEKESKLKVELQRGKELKEVSFDEITKITIKPTGTTKNDNDCNFESNYEPRLYFCKQATTSKAFLKDGTSWAISDDSMYKWLFYFEDQSSQEFWLKTHRVIEQEESMVGLNDSDVNNDLIAKLKEQMVTELTTTLLVQIDFE